MKHRGVICDKCGVEVTLSKVRRERLGHIELASPCSQLWFSRDFLRAIGNLLDITMRDLERILYFEGSSVVDPGEVRDQGTRPAARGKYRELIRNTRPVPARPMGAEAIKELLRAVEVEKLSEQLREKMES